MKPKVLLVLSLLALLIGYWAFRAALKGSNGAASLEPRSVVAEGGGAFPAVIFDNTGGNGGVNLDGNAPASHLDVAFPFDAGAADDFVLPASPECLWSIESVRFHGTYWNGESPGAISAIRIIFWPDTPDGPDGRTFGVPDLSKAAAVHEIPGNGGETATSAVGVFSYEVALPQAFDVLPNERWWIQIQAALPYPPQWGLAVTHGRQGETPYEYFDLLGLPAWTPIADPGDLAFQLVGSPKAISCDDENACTDDSCDSSGGCVHDAITCDDGNACTQDSCDPLSGCAHETILCDDGDACTTDTCDPASGCITESVVCDDDNACTDDTCDPNTGCQFTQLSCDDDNACTTNSCDPVNGCTFTEIECDDGDPCTSDACSGGACQSIGPPDFDADRDIDLSDVVALIECMGDGGGEGCPCTDLSGNGVTDLYDFAVIQRVFTGGK